LRSEESNNRWKQAVALIVGILYSIALWNFWLHLGSLTFAGFLFGVLVWLLSLMFVVLIASVALWPVTVALLTISAAAVISFAVLDMSEWYTQLHFKDGGQQQAAGSQPGPKATSHRSSVHAAATVFRGRETADAQPEPEATIQGIEHAAITVFRQGGTEDAVTHILGDVGLTANGCKRRATATDYRDCEFVSKYKESISVSFYRGQAQSVGLTFPAERLDKLVKAVSSVYGQPRVADNDTDDKDLTTYDWGTLQDSISAGKVLDGIHGWASFVRSTERVGNEDR
jgi:hypothetical protein